jgi:DNA helicase-2/ATP-dependent DNA helicase PcrA
LHASCNNIGLLDALRDAKQVDSLSEAPKAKIAVFVNMLEQFGKDIGGEVAPLAERVFVESGLRGSLESGAARDEGALENVAELINAAGQYDQEAEEPSLLDYMQQISLFSDADSYDVSSERRWFAAA